MALIWALLLLALSSKTCFSIDEGREQCVNCAASDSASSDNDALSKLESIGRISLPPDAIQQHNRTTFYTIVFNPTGDESVMQASRRYSEFDMLRQELTLVPSDGKFPRKQMLDWVCTWWKSLQSCVEDRRLGLEAYLNRALHQIRQTADKAKHIQAKILLTFLIKQPDVLDDVINNDNVPDFHSAAILDDAAVPLSAEDIDEPVAQVSQQPKAKQSKGWSREQGDLVSEYHDTDMGIAFTMVRSTSWGGSWGLVGQPGGKTRHASIMTHATPMRTFEADSWGLVFHITPGSNFWKHFLAIKSGPGAGDIAGGPGDGGSHTSPDNMELPEIMGNDYEWFTSQKNGILAKYNTVYGADDYNEFKVMGFSKRALAGIIHYTGGTPYTPSDKQMCGTLRVAKPGKWPIYAYDRTSLSIERYLEC